MSLFHGSGGPVLERGHLGPYAGFCHALHVPRGWVGAPGLLGAGA